MVTLKLPTYVRREEPLRGRAHRLVTIFTSGARRELKRPLNIIALVLAVAFGVISTIFNIFLAPLINPGQEITAAYFYNTLVNPPVMLLILVVATAVGSGLISDDIRHMSLTLYLSRPITAIDYILAKASIVALALVIAVAFPGILGPIIAGLLVYVTWEVAVEALLAGLALGLLATALFSSLVLVFSSLTSRKGVAAAATFSTVLALQIVSGAVSNIFESEEILHLSLYQNLLAVGRILYGVEANGIAWDVALTILLGIILVSSLVAYLRVRTMEVVAQ
ncbi:MAG: ABC transporter permease [Thermoplasmata archaeon]